MASPYLLNTARPKGDLPCRALYSAADRFVKTLHSFFDEIRASDNGVFLEDKFNGFVAAGVPLSRTVIATVAHILINNLRLSRHDSGDRLKFTEQQALNRQRRSSHRIRNLFF